jgi:hypothetical protein
LERMTTSQHCFGQLLACPQKRDSFPRHTPRKPASIMKHCHPCPVTLCYPCPVTVPLACARSRPRGRVRRAPLQVVPAAAPIPRAVARHGAADEGVHRRTRGACAPRSIAPLRAGWRD